MSPTDTLLAELADLPDGDVAFDLDGTLLHGDIGYAAVEVRQRRGDLPAAVAPWFAEPGWPAFWALDTHRQCVLCVEALAGLDRAAVEAVADEAFAAGLVAVRPEVCELAARLALRHRVWIVTGSAEPLGQAAGARVGVHRVIGVRAAAVDGRYTAAVETPIPWHEGKVTLLARHLPDRPVFAIGDSAGDLALLRWARVARTTGGLAGQGFPAWP